MKDRDPLGQPLYDIVAVGRGRGKVLLATLVSPADKLEWRFREIQVSPSGSTVHDVELSAGGTKALVVFSDGTPRVFDLTERITGISASGPFLLQHRLPELRFPLLSNGKVCLLDDLGNRSKEGCTDAKAGVVHEDGRVLYALDDGRLVVVSPGGSKEQLAYRLPEDTQFQLLAGHRGDARDFLVLVNEVQRTLNQYLYSHSTMKVGLRLERLVTNTQGFYFAVSGLQAADPQCDLRTTYRERR